MKNSGMKNALKNALKALKRGVFDKYLYAPIVAILDLAHVKFPAKADFYVLSSHGLGRNAMMLFLQRCGVRMNWTDAFASYFRRSYYLLCLLFFKPKNSRFAVVFAEIDYEKEARFLAKITQKLPAIMMVRDPISILKSHINFKVRSKDAPSALRSVITRQNGGYNITQNALDDLEKMVRYRGYGEIRGVFETEAPDLSFLRRLIEVSPQGSDKKTIKEIVLFNSHARRLKGKISELIFVDEKDLSAENAFGTMTRLGERLGFAPLVENLEGAGGKNGRKNGGIRGAENVACGKSGEDLVRGENGERGGCEKDAEYGAERKKWCEKDDGRDFFTHKLYGDISTLVPLHLDVVGLSGASESINSTGGGQRPQCQGSNAPQTRHGGGGRDDKIQLLFTTKQHIFMHEKSVLDVSAMFFDEPLPFGLGVFALGGAAHRNLSLEPALLALLRAHLGEILAAMLEKIAWIEARKISEGAIINYINADANLRQKFVNLFENEVAIVEKCAPKIVESWGFYRQFMEGGAKCSAH